jgi:hypothetical protein
MNHDIYLILRHLFLDPFSHYETAICMQRPGSAVLLSPDLDQAGDLIAVETLLVVDRDQSAAAGAAVFAVLLLDEILYPSFLDVFQILLDAHSVVLPVAFVQAVEQPAGILVAGIAEGGLAFCIVVDPGALLEDMPANLATGAASRALAVFEMVDVGQVAAAGGTVYPTGCD